MGEEVTFESIIGDDTELLEHVKTAGFKKPVDVIKMHRELEKKIGTMVTVPTAESSDEDWEKYLAKTAPTEDYDVSPPEGLPEGTYDENLATAMKDLAKELGISQRQFAKLWSGYWGYGGKAMEALDKKAAEIVANDEKELKAKWKGDDYDINMALSTKAMNKMKVMDILKSSGIQNHPAIREAFRFISEHLEETKTKGHEKGEGPPEAKPVEGGVGLTYDYLKKEP